MSETFDVVVIGAGPAGENAAGCVAAGGLSVAMVEHELLGGECSYWACIPSKALLRPAEALAAVRRVPGARQAVTGELDVDAVLAHRDTMISGFDDAGQVRWAEANGITVVRGHGRLAGERTVEVDGRTLTATKAVVLATGSRAVIPPIEGLHDAHPWDSRDVTTAKQVPERLMVIGGGVVAAEMAWAMRALGSQVTVLVRGQRLLEKEEPFVGEELAAAFLDAGIDVRTGTSARAVRRAGDGPVTAVLSDGGELVADEVLVATGRRATTDGLGLETVGVDPKGPVQVDERLRVGGRDWLYAVGDVNGRALLTHMGKYQGRIVGKYLAGTSSETVAWADDRAVTRVVFTDPNVAAVGLTEAQAQERGLNVRVGQADLGDTAGASERGEGVRGTCKLVVDADRNVIVGATFMGPEAADLLHAATIAVIGEVPVDRLRHAVPAFPTVSEVWLSLLSELRVPPMMR
jgi:dihydrolipoamide dehydrogenase